MSESYDPASRPSRAAWKDRHAGYLQDQARRTAEYGKAFRPECAHGTRVRKIGRNDGGMWAALECPRGIPNCALAYVPAQQVYQEWRQGDAVAVTTPMVPPEPAPAPKRWRFWRRA